MPAEKSTCALATPQRRQRRARQFVLLLAAAATLAGVAAWHMPASPPAAPVAGDAERGQRLVAAYHCGHCHAIPGAAAAGGTLGPSLQAIARRSYIAGVVPLRPDTLQRWIVDPASLVPGTPMPAMGVNERDAQDIVAYLATLR